MKLKVKLSLKVQQEILGELGSMPRLKESLDTLETVMAFLATAVGVSVDMQLSTYAENLKMQFSPKVSSQHLCDTCNIHSCMYTSNSLQDTTTLPVDTCLVIVGDSVYSPGNTACDEKAGIIVCVIITISLDILSHIFIRNRLME